MRVLVLGGYGLIGLPVMRALLAAGHEVTGLARSRGKGEAQLPAARWIGADIATLLTPEDWREPMEGIDAVVNASGALQDGGRDTLDALQHRAILALIDTCESVGAKRFVQISAPGASAKSETAFYRTKGLADAALKASTLGWTILRPGVVIAPTAYGGTALLRTLAAFPLVQPLVLPRAPVQTIAVDNVAGAVVSVIKGGFEGVDADLVEPQPRTLEETVALFRAWLGFSKAKTTLRLPRALGYTVAALADVAGRLGWRSPLRSTALRVLEDGVTGSANAWETAGGAPLASLERTLAGMPATRQERVFARTHLVFPLLVMLLAGFWIASGMIGLWQSQAALAVFGNAVPPMAGKFAIFGGGIADIAIGIALLFRRTLKVACIASVALACAYLVGGTLLTPAIWADPLGPFVKVIPTIGLALAVTAIAEER